MSDSCPLETLICGGANATSNISLMGHKTAVQGYSVKRIKVIGLPEVCMRLFSREENCINAVVENYFYSVPGRNSTAHIVIKIHRFSKDIK